MNKCVHHIMVTAGKCGAHFTSMYCWILDTKTSMLWKLSSFLSLLLHDTLLDADEFRQWNLFFMVSALFCRVFSAGPDDVTRPFLTTERICHHPSLSGLSVLLSSPVRPFFFFKDHNGPNCWSGHSQCSCCDSPVSPALRTLLTACFQFLHANVLGSMPVN